MPTVKLISVRLSFPDLWEATQFDGQGPFSYKAAFLFELGSDNHKAVSAAIKAVAEEKWGAKAAGVLETIKGRSKDCCLYPGDTKEYDGYEGMMVLSASRKQDDGRPLIIDQRKNPLTPEDGKPYAGCYVNASIDIWAQDNKWGKAVRAQLRGVQFVKDGDAFSGSAPAKSDEFDSLEVEDDLV